MVPSITTFEFDIRLEYCEAAGGPFHGLGSGASGRREARRDTRAGVGSATLFANVTPAQPSSERAVVYKHLIARTL